MTRQLTLVVESPHLEAEQLGENEVIEMAGKFRRYFNGPGGPIGMVNETGQRRYFHSDTQGTVQCLTDETGAVTDRFASDAFGVQVKRTGNTINRNWYIGASGYYRGERDGYYVRERWLDATRGRWISQDPVPERQHPYWYANNLPSLEVDPSGLWSVTGAATCQDNWLIHTATRKWCGLKEQVKYIKFYCNPHPEEKACKLYTPGMTGSYPNVTRHERNDIECPPCTEDNPSRCRNRGSRTYQSQLNSMVRCGETIRVIARKGTKTCYVDIEIIEAGPAPNQRPNRIVDLHMGAASALYSCLNPGKTIKNCKQFGVIQNVTVTDLNYYL